MMKPDLLLADEPTGNLDAASGAQVLDLLFGLARERGMTLLIATHSGEAAARAGRRIELDDGRIARDGPAGAPPAAARAGTP